jgi:DMSO/TMAO reductase YedYZ molybdopterin-dependent catalytic subunit
MDRPVNAKPAADPRDYLAEERTLLSWVRSGIALVGFGFVVARFGIFLEQLHLFRRSAPRVFALVWSRAHHDRRTRECVFRPTFYAPGWRSGPESVRRSFTLKARCVHGVVPGVGRHRHVDLLDLVSGAASRRGIRRHRKRQIGRRSWKARNVDNTIQFPPAGLTVRQKKPKNLEAPFDRIDSSLTPTELFYIRSHFPIPALDRASYQLRIDGAVRCPFALSYDELRSMPSETRVATLECAGNSRVFLVPQVHGPQWELGAVCNAEWTGVPLRAGGLEEDACEIVFDGADRGTPKEEPVPPEPISFAWSLPRGKAIQPEVLIAYQMNGCDLPQDHGFLARAIVPGHYGMASVTWAQAEFLDPVRRHAWRRWKFDWLIPKEPGQ